MCHKPTTQGGQSGHGTPRKIGVSMSGTESNGTQRRQKDSVGLSRSFTGATKAPGATAVYDVRTTPCCKDLKECGVQVKVIQGEYQDWHYKRVWNRGKNSKYQFKCKNEANVSGVSRFHHTVVNEIHRCLAEGRPVLGKIIAELPPQSSRSGNWQERHRTSM